MLPGQPRPEPEDAQPLSPVAEHVAGAVPPEAAGRLPRRIRAGRVVRVVAIAAAGFAIAFFGAQLAAGTGSRPAGLVAAVVDATRAFIGPRQAAVAATEPNLTLRAGMDAEQDRLDAAVAAMADAGFVVDVARVPFRISRTRIGYFHDADRAAAESLKAALAGGTVGGAELRDYRGLQPGPPPGVLEVWIEG